MTKLTQRNTETLRQEQDLAPTPIDLADFDLRQNEIVMIAGQRGRYRVIGAAQRNGSSWINLFGGIKGREMMRSVDPAKIKRLDRKSRNNKKQA